MCSTATYIPANSGSSDVCRKHALTCAKKDESITIPESRRGRKSLACEACFNRKQYCDKASPCGRCVSRNLACKPRDVQDGAPAAAQATEHSSARTKQKPDLRFLRGLINPAQPSMLEVFRTDDDGVNDDTGSDNASYPEEMIGASPPELDDIMNVFPWSFASMLDDAFRNFIPDEDFDVLTLDDSPQHTIFSDDGLQQFETVAKVLIQDLHSLHCNLFTMDPTYGERFDLNVAMSVFSAANLRTLSSTSFRLSHVHFPIVHSPSFGSGQTSKVLILAVAMIGALRATPTQDAIAARDFIRLTEEFIFRELAKTMLGLAPVIPTTSVLETMQAAIIIAYTMMINNNVMTRRRCRTHRLPTLVAAARYFGVCKLKRYYGIDWAQFIYDETCIR